MKNTNKENLPDLLYQALSENRPPVEGEIHVTALIGPAMIDYLRRAHWDGLEDDASNRLFALLGTGLHAAIANDGRLEQAKQIIGEVIDNWNTLDRDVQLCVLQDLLKSIDCSNQSGIESNLRVSLSDKWTLVGTDDHYDEMLGKIMDWKITSVWSVLYADHNWAEQLNVYAYMRRTLGYEVHELSVWALLRDWQKSKAKYGGDPKYPKIPFVEVHLPLWSMEEQEEFIYKRLSEFDGKPKPCTPQDMWETPTVYKVMKKGRKSAMIATVWRDGEKCNLLTEADAIHAAQKKGETVDGTKIYIQKFKGETKRCHDYCVVNPFCKQYQETLE